MVEAAAPIELTPSGRGKLDRSCLLAIFYGAWMFIGLYLIFALTRQGTTALLFLVAPFASGSIVSFSVNFKEQIFKTTLLSLFVNGLVTLVFLPEGVVCLLMASPIILIMTLMGAWGCAWLRKATESGKPRRILTWFIACILVFATADTVLMAYGSQQEITESEFVIDAKPEECWARLSLNRAPRAPIPGWLDWWMHAPQQYAFSGEGVGAQRWVDFGAPQAGDDEDRPRGKMIFTVTRWEPGKVAEFTSSDNQTRLGKWIDLGLTRVELTDAGGKTKVKLTTRWKRKLGPGFYFTPFLRAGVEEAQRVLAAELQERP